MVAFVGLVLALLGLWKTGGSSLPHLGLLLCALPMNAFLGIVFTTNTARTDANLIAYSIVLLIGLIIGVYAFSINSAETSIFVFSVLIALGWLAYVRWYSVFEDRLANEAQLGEGKNTPKTSRG